jgi:hypothetical protein
MQFAPRMRKLAWMAASAAMTDWKDDRQYPFPERDYRDETMPTRGLRALGTS